MLREHSAPGFMFVLLALMGMAAIVGGIFILWELILWSEQRDRRAKIGMLAMGSATIFAPAYYIFLAFAAAPGLLHDAVPQGMAGFLPIPLVSTILVGPAIYYAIRRKLLIPGIGSALLVVIFMLEFVLIVS